MNASEQSPFAISDQIVKDFKEKLQQCEQLFAKHEIRDRALDTERLAKTNEKRAELVELAAKDHKVNHDPATIPEEKEHIGRNAEKNVSEHEEMLRLCDKRMVQYESMFQDFAQSLRKGSDALLREVIELGKSALAKLQKMRHDNDGKNGRTAPLAFFPLFQDILTNQTLLQSPNLSQTC